VRWLAHRSGSRSRGAGLIRDAVPLEADHRPPLELEPVKASESQSGSSRSPVRDQSRGQSGGQWEHAGIGIQLAAFVVRFVVDHRPRTAPVTAHPTCVHGTRHGPPDLRARHPSRPTRPACTAPVTAHPTCLHGARHGSCTDPPRLSARLITAFCRAVRVGLPRLVRRSSPPRFAGQIFLPGFPPVRRPCDDDFKPGSPRLLHGLSRPFHGSSARAPPSSAGHFLLDSPVKSSSPGFPLVRRSCDDDSEHGSCTAFHGLFTALPGAGRGAVVGPRRSRLG
jgi:hypothetical protein